MKFELRVKIDNWNEYVIHYEEEGYERLLIFLHALLTEFNDKKKGVNNVRSKI